MHELVLDDTRIAHVHNAWRSIHLAGKHTDNPLITADRPW